MEYTADKIEIHDTPAVYGDLKNSLLKLYLARKSGIGAKVSLTSIPHMNNSV